MSTFFKTLFGSSSKSVIYVHTAKSRYFTGDVIEGTVSFSVYEPLHVDGIVLKFKGFEETKLVEQRTVSYQSNNQTHTRTESIHHNQKQIIFRRKIDLIGYKSTMNPGIYVYPFKFKLDENIPGSFSMHQGDAFGQIVYKVKAEVMRPGMFTANIKHTQCIQVVSNFQRNIQKVQAMKDAKVTKLCCIDMGNLSCSAILDKNAYSPGDVANLIISIDNTASDVTLKHVSFKLVNRVNMRAKSYSQSFRTINCKNRAPSIPKGETAHINFALNLPPVLTPTTIGALISSYYEFDVVMSVPCSKDIVLSLPVTIFAPVPKDYIPDVQYPNERPPHYQDVVDIKPEMFQFY